MSKLLFCHYQPNGLGIKLLRINPGMPSGDLGRNQVPGNRGPNPFGELDPLDVFGRDKEKDAEAAFNQAVELVRVYSNAFLAQLAQLQGEAVAPEEDSSARSVVDRTDNLEFRRHELKNRWIELGQSLDGYLRPAVEVLNMRRLIDTIYKIIQKLEESPSKPMLDDLQLLLRELEYYCPNKQDNRPDENAQLQNEQLAQAVQDAKELLATIKQRFPVIIVQTAIKTVNEAIAELAIFSPYDEDIIRRSKRIESFQSLLLNLLRLYYRYFGPYVSRLGRQYPDNELLIALQQAMVDINSLEEEIGSSGEKIRPLLMSEPNELKEKLNNLLNNLKNRLENELLPKAEMVINSDNTPFNSLRFGSFS